MIKSFSSDFIPVLKELAQKFDFDAFEIGISGVEDKHHLRSEAISSLSSFGKHSANYFEIYFLVDFNNRKVEAIPSPIFIFGFYNKFSRNIAQTFHYCFKCKGKGCFDCSYSGKVSSESVQELVESIVLPAFHSEEGKFHGCGREDVDVLMLGKGRPFVLEILKPGKRNVDLQSLEEIINSEFKGKIKVHSLSFCSKKKVIEVKNSIFEKIYHAKVKCSATEKIDSLLNKRIEIEQLTPSRVEKRRVLKVRKKYAVIISANKGEFLGIDLLASHGLYVKEFISGDNERTNPSLSSLLGSKCECVELDVLEIKGF